MLWPFLTQLDKCIRLAGVGLLIVPAVVLADIPPTPGSVRETLPKDAALPPRTPAQVLIPDQPMPVIHDRNGRRFQVHAFRFQGNTVFTEMRLKQVVDRFKDLELNLYDLNVAADAVTEFYHDRGYTLARAVIPPQKVEDGVVTLAVVEGRIGQVLFSGQNRYDLAMLQSCTPKLVPGSLVTTEHLERSLLLLNDLPGLKVRATLSPGAEFGRSDVLAKVEEKPFGLSLNLDNTGRKETGRSRLDTNLEINNPLGIGDQLGLRALVTDHGLMTYAKIGYNLPLNGDGLRLSLSHSEVHYDVAGSFAALGLDGLARSSEVGLQYALVRSRGENRSLSLSYRDTQMTQRAFGVLVSEVRMPLWSVGYQYNSVGEDASLSNFTAQLASNFKNNNTGLKQDAEIARFELDGNYLLPLDRLWDVYLRGNLVFSDERLPDSEKFSIGGPGSVRGYRSSELRGDSGVQGSLEFRRRLSLWTLPGSLSLFADSGRVIYKAPRHSDAWESLSSVGVGLTLYPTSKTTLKIEAAVPVGGPYRAGDGEKNRLWASLSTSF